MKRNKTGNIIILIILFIVCASMLYPIGILVKTSTEKSVTLFETSDIAAPEKRTFIDNYKIVLTEKHLPRFFISPAGQDLLHRAQVREGGLGNGLQRRLQRRLGQWRHSGGVDRQPAGRAAEGPSVRRLANDAEESGADLGDDCKGPRGTQLPGGE